MATTTTDGTQEHTGARKQDANIIGESTHILAPGFPGLPAKPGLLSDDPKLSPEERSANELYSYADHSTAAAEEEEKGGASGRGCCEGCSRSDMVDMCRVDRALLPIKLFYFSFIGGLGCVLPYVSVFLKQLGLNPQQIGLISGIRPVIGFISGPLWGILGDRYNIRRCLLLFSITAWLGFYTGFYFIPAAGRVGVCPESTHRHAKQLEKRLLQRDYSQQVTAGNSSWVVAPDGLPLNHSVEYTPEQASVLRESLGWLYDEAGLDRVFLLSFIVIIGGEFVQAPTTALSDAGALQTLGPKGLHNYGAQRAWGPVGWAISSFAGGGMVSGSREPEVVCGVKVYFSDYHILTYVFVVFMVISFICAIFLKFKDYDDPEQVELTPVDENGKEDISSMKNNNNDNTTNTRAVFKLFLNVHYGSWLTTCFFVGICNGVIWGFLFWHLENLGADQFLMGVDSVVQCVAEFASFFLVNHVIKWIGHMGIMYAGLLGYSARFMVYAFITNPWWVVPADILQGVTFSCVWVSMTSYTALAVPEGSLATIQGILHGVYFGLGNGLGHLLGGILIGSFGAVVTFFSMGVSCIVVFLIFIIAQKCSKKPEENLGFGYDDLDKASKAAESK